MKRDEKRNLVLNNDMRMNDMKNESLALNNDDGKKLYKKKKQSTKSIYKKKIKK